MNVAVISIIVIIIICVAFFVGPFTTLIRKSKKSRNALIN